jgi:hypothetical protein
VRILLSTRHFGGAGGIQRHVASTIRTLGEHHEIDVCARIVEPGEYGALPTRGRVIPRWRWSPVARMLRRTSDRLVRVRPDRYDVYLHYQYAEWLGDRFPADVSVAIPCGRTVAAYEAKLDAVLLEAPDNMKWVTDPAKAVLLPPPLTPLSARSEPVADLPDDFFLTVFNSHSPGKGLAELIEVAPSSPLPIVWCHSTLWEHPDPSTLEGVVVVEDPSQAQLRFLYERCRAYISFDRSPGFGWSLADGLQYGAPAIARPSGVMTLPDLDTRGTWTYDSADELLGVLRGGQFRRIDRDLGILDPARFLERFEQLADERRRPAVPG